MINYIIINGTNSNTINGLGINELPPISKPPLRVQTEEIDGRDGDISTNLGYGAYDKTISIGLFGTGYDINEVISFFNGEGTVVFSNEPNKYYKYKIINQIDYESLLKFKSATITFHCQPFKYPLEETPLEIEYEYIEQEGVESATMNNTNGGTSLKIDLKGNTSQERTNGNNLIDTRGGTTSTDNQVTFTPTYNSKGELQSIKVNGTASAMSTYQFPNYATLKAGTYYISKGSTDNVYLLIVDSGGSSYITTKDSESSFTLSADKSVKLYLRVMSGTAITNAILYPMVATTSGATYEPFTFGASPNPDYPQQIHEVSGDNEVVVCGKNLFDEKTILASSNFTYSNGYYSGLTNELRSYMSANRNIIDFKDNTQYTISLTGYLGTATNVRVRFIYTDLEWSETTYLTSSSSRISGTSTAGKTIAYIILNYSTAGTIYIKDFQVEENAIATTYEPYQSQTYELSLGDIKMRGIGTYEDYFVRGIGINKCSSITKPANANLKFNFSKDIQKTITISFTSNEKLSNNSLYLEVDGTSLGNVGSITGSANTRVSKTIELSDENYQAIKNGTNIDLLLYKNGANFNIPTDGMIENGSSVSVYEPYNAKDKWCKYNAVRHLSLAIADMNNSEDYPGWKNVPYIGEDYPNEDGSLSNKSMTNVGVNCNFNTRYLNRILYTIKSSWGGLTETQIKSTYSNLVFELYYGLNTPYLSLIEDTTLIEQLDNIQNAMSYEGQTNIGQVNNDKAFIISAKALEQGSDEVVVNNIGNVYAKPTIALEGTGETDIYLNNTEILKVDLSEKNKITIDTNNMEAYDPTDNSLANRKVIGNYNSMTLPSGNTTMKITGALTKATITDYSRWL